MRASFDGLIQQSIDSVIDDATVTYDGMSDTRTFIKREINNTVSYLYSLMKEYKLQPPPITALTEEGEIYYAYPPGFSKLESLTVALGTHTPPIRIVQSQQEWDQLQQIPVSAGFPSAVFPRQYDYGIYPTPQSAYAMTLNGHYHPVNMTVSDYTTGLIKLTEDSANIVGSAGATFTSSMVGRWLVKTTDDIPSGDWYKIVGYTSPTIITVNHTYTGSTVEGQAYMIAESPDIPDELHDFIPYRVASTYYALRRKDLVQSKAMLNFFYTGDFDNPNRRGNIKGGILAVLKDLKERGHGNSQIIEMGNSNNSNYMRDGIWSLTLGEI